MDSTQEPTPVPPPEAPEGTHKVLVKKATHLSKEFVATVVSLVTTAFGVVVALAWNEALTSYFDEVFEPGRAVTALFVYAILITGIGVGAIVMLSRLVKRIDAQPVEFAYPVKPKPPAK